MTDKQPNIAIVILAAGASSRMGDRTKQLLPWKGTTLLGHTLNQAQAADVNRTYVVLGAQEEAIRGAVDFTAAHIIRNPSWSKGLGSSIAAAVEHLSSLNNPHDALLICLADQPLIDTNFLNAMIDQFADHPNKILTTRYGHRSGVPALFGRAYFKALRQLDQDFGAKEVLAKYAENVMALDAEGKEIDVDSWEAYQALLRKQQT